MNTFSDEELDLNIAVSPQGIPGDSDWAEKFSIPWGKFNNNLMSACYNKERVQSRERRDMIRKLCADIGHITKKPGRRNLRIIAKQIVKKYPETFQDKIGNDVIGDGTTTIIRYLEHCMDNYNRSKNDISVGNLYSQVEDDAGTTQQSKPQKNVKDSYGCLKWQPTSLPSGETKDTQIEKQNWLIAEFRKKERNSEQVSAFMRQTYVSQRLCINKTCSTILYLQEKWPFLFEESEMLDHFEELMGYNIGVVMETGLIEKGPKIYNFMKSIQQTRKEVKKCLHEMDSDDKFKQINTKGIVIIYLLMSYFSEERTRLLLNFEETQSKDDVQDDCSVPKTPCICVFGNQYMVERYMICIDRCPVMTLTSFQSAIKMLLAAFYVFNIEYPSEASITLEFIQRVFAKLNPARGNKTQTVLKKKQSTIHPKVLGLVNCLRDFESIWIVPT